jgi:hypothetical protein
MVGCSDMKKDQIYTCPSCGIELQVVKECTECAEDDTCCKDPCSFSCCGVPLMLKE